MQDKLITPEKDFNGKYGIYGGQYVPETLIPALDQLVEIFHQYVNDDDFLREYHELLQNYVGRPTPLYFAKRLTEHYGKAKIYLKREDLNHTGAHKINNALGQALIAQKLGKKRIIAETGAGQHGVATATVCALLGLECTVYMGAEDIIRQQPNVYRMKLLGATVRSVEVGQKTLKEATSEAIRDWVNNVRDSHYILGSASGPYPYPAMVKAFQSIIGIESRQQILSAEGVLPDHIVACVGGGSNAIGIFSAFLDDTDTRLIGIEAGGDDVLHAATLTKGRAGILHGTMTYLLQDEYGIISDAHSISAGLDYPGVGPEHSYLKDIGRIHYDSITDDQALRAVHLLSRLEGIIPALESAHAIAYLEYLMPQTEAGQIVVVNVSGRGDKDLQTIIEHMQD